jgi:hypothetical protein
MHLVLRMLMHFSTWLIKLHDVLTLTSYTQYILGLWFFFLAALDLKFKILYPEKLVMVLCTLHGDQLIKRTDQEKLTLQYTPSL